MARLLVTGVAGFIGSHLTELLLAEGHTVTGVDSLRTGKRENLAAVMDHEHFSFVHADAGEPDLLLGLLRDLKADAVVHLAALVSVAESVSDPDSNFALNVTLTQQVAEAVRMAGTPRVVFASSAAIYGNPAVLPLPESAPAEPLSPYGAAKLASEVLLAGHARCFGFHAAFLRFFNVYGPRQDPRSPYSGVISIFRDCCQAGQPVTFHGDGLQTRDFIAVADLARVIATAAVRPEPLPDGAYNVGTGVATTLLDLLDTLRSAHPDIPAPIFTAPRPGDIRHSCADVSKLAAALGWKPATPLATGLRWE